MCRLYGFKSSIDSGVHHSLIAAENALWKQSEKHPDGWGVAFYNGGYPHLIRGEKAAQEDTLFADISAVVSTKTLIAHVRQATVGAKGILNTHPFQFGPWVFAHNGQVSGFKENGKVSQSKQLIFDKIAPKYQKNVFGQTDSEMIFAVFLTELSREVSDVCSPHVSFDVLKKTIQSTVDFFINTIKATQDDPHLLTFLISNGHQMVGFAYDKPLYFSTHKSKCPERETCPAFKESICEKKAAQETHVNHLIMSSEQIEEGPNIWEELNKGECVGVNQSMRFWREQIVE